MKLSRATIIVALMLLMTTTVFGQSVENPPGGSEGQTPQGEDERNTELCLWEQSREQARCYLQFKHDNGIDNYRKQNGEAKIAASPEVIRRNEVVLANFVNFIVSSSSANQQVSRLTVIGNITGDYQLEHLMIYSLDLNAATVEWKREGSLKTEAALRKLLEAVRKSYQVEKHK